MRTDMLHGDVIAGMSAYDEFEDEIVCTEVSGYHAVRKHCLPEEEGNGCAWSAEDEEFADECVQRMQTVDDRSDADVRRDVLRALLMDSLVPMTVDAQVSEGIVTLSGTFAAEPERAEATYLAGIVPGVFGVIDELSRRPARAGEEPDSDAEPMKQAVADALEHTAIRDVADLTVEAPSTGTVVLSGGVQSRSDHDLAIATAWSVREVEAVDDCIEVES